ncbi:MAG: hypothetical protein D6815_11750 [Candidatus Dadabacteria bacterium]|nr:MAG: hypothetical protein D6815_11750 [Candidatus Dadabacteria bacterium]
MIRDGSFMSGWKRSLAAGTALLLACACTAVSCSKKGSETTGTAKRASLPKIEPIEGMRYYVGGPVMKPDKWGRLRIAAFNGQITAPSSRGLLIGFKENDDGTFEYRTWVNGRPVQKSVGFRDQDGLLWFTKQESYDAQARVIARQSFSYDNDREVMTVTHEQLDPETGKVVKTTTNEIPYAPPAASDEEEESEGASKQAGTQ